jgi:hypothetical protein
MKTQSASSNEAALAELRSLGAVSARKLMRRACQSQDFAASRGSRELQAASLSLWKTRNLKLLYAFESAIAGHELDRDRCRLEGPVRRTVALSDLCHRSYLSTRLSIRTTATNSTIASEEQRTIAA